MLLGDKFRALVNLNKVAYAMSMVVSWVLKV